MAGDGEEEAEREAELGVEAPPGVGARTAPLGRGEAGVGAVLSPVPEGWGMLQGLCQRDALCLYWQDGAGWVIDGARIWDVCFFSGWPVHLVIASKWNHQVTRRVVVIITRSRVVPPFTPHPFIKNRHNQVIQVTIVGEIQTVLRTQFRINDL